jgi:hypothetical protein
MHYRSFAHRNLISGFPFRDRDKAGYEVMPEMAHCCPGKNAAVVCKPLAGLAIKAGSLALDSSSTFSSSRRKPGSIFGTVNVKMDDQPFGC